MWKVPDGVEMCSEIPLGDVQRIKQGAKHREFLCIRVSDYEQKSFDIIYRAGVQSIPWIHIIVGRGASLTLQEKIEIHSSIDSLCTVSIEEEGVLSRTVTEAFIPRAEGRFVFQAFLGKRASLACCSATVLPFSTRISEIFLEGEDSTARHASLSLAGKGKEHREGVKIEHLGTKSSSSQLFKGVVAGSSHIESDVIIRAQGSKSQQLSRFLAIDSGAKTSNKPNLNVFADDVEATHGATTGEIDKDLIWYLKSRGLSEKEALSLCVKGFCKEIIDLLPNKKLLERDLEEMLHG